MSEANNFDTMYRALNPEQKSAVDAIEGPVMVLAGPGTGKTQVLAMRIANILQKTQMDPWNILCLTFTESGVVAMRERLLKIIGQPAYQVRIHTFHSFCNDIIRDHPEVFARRKEAQPNADPATVAISTQGFSGQAQALTDIDRVRLLRELIDRLVGTSPLKPFGAPYLYLKDISGNIQALKQEGISPSDFGAVLDRLEQFSDVMSDGLEAFSALKPKERTDGSCTTFQERVIKAVEAAELPVALRVVPERYYARLQERLAAAESEREAQKSRTTYKNEMKKWIGGIERNVPKQRELQRVYEWYEEALLARGRYDYEDMIIMVLKAWEESDYLLAEAQEQFQYILADEYQDTNGAQNEVLMKLGSFGEQPNIFVVGDDKQSIYRFQGASLQNLLDFYGRYRDDVRVVSLKNNYRSQEMVLRAAGEVIAHNEESVTKYVPEAQAELAAQAALPAVPIVLQVMPSEGVEDAWIVREVQRLLEFGVEPEEVAVLYRYHRDGAELLRLLTCAGVPARLEAGEDALDDRLVRQLMTLLQFLISPARTELLVEALQWPWWGWSDLDALKVTAVLGARGEKPPALRLEDDDLLKQAGVVEPHKFREWREKIAQWRRLATKVTLQDLLHHIVTESGLLDYVLHEAQALEVLERLSRLLEEAKQVNMNQRDVRLEDFIEYLNLLQEHGVSLTTNPWQGPGKAVRLMTAHKAKGLEFEHVILTRLNDKHWGNNREPNKLPLPHGLVRWDMVVASENNEDERRLFYVAMTRAKQSLTMTRSTHAGSGRPTVPSLFLEEIPVELKEEKVLVEEVDETLKRLTDNMTPLPRRTGKEVAEWVSSLLSNYVMSVTHLNNYLECPYQFYIKNLLHVPSARNVYQALGTAAHAALQEFSVLHGQRRSLPSAQELLGAFQKHLDGELLSPLDYEDLLAVGREQLTAYYEHYKNVFSPDVLTEYDFRSHGVRVGDLVVTGKLDKIQLLNESEKAVDGTWQRGAQVKVVDYKTGSADKGIKKLVRGESYWRQVVFYQLLCDASDQFLYEMVSGEIDFIKPNKSNAFVRKEIKVTKQDVVDLEKQIGNVWEEMQALRFLEKDAMCGECEVCVAKNNR